MRTWRAISIVAEALGLGVVLGLATAGGVVLHMGMPAPRRFVAARVNGILGGALAGKVTIGRVGSLHLTHVEGVDAQVFDPEGHLVLDVRGLRARFGTFGLLRSVVTAKRLVVDVPEISIDGVEVVLEENAAGELGLQRAFDSRAPTTSAPSRGTYLTVGAIEVRHAWARGHLAVMPVIDADLKDLAGGLASTPAGTALDVRHLVVVGRGLPGMSPAGLVVASAFLPSNEAGELRVNARYDGRLGDIPVRADGSLTGKVVAGSVDVPETDPAAFAALAPGRLHLGAPLRARATVHGDLPVLEADLRAPLGAGGLTASATVTLPEGDRSELRASARVNADSLDVSLLETRAPPSKLTTLLEASIVSYPGGKLTGTYRVESQVGELGGQVVPAIAARGELTEDSIRGTAEIAEIGAPTDVRFALRPRAGGTSPDHLEFMLRTKAAALDAIPRVGALARGRARVSVEGSLELDTLLIAARADGDVLGLERSGVALSSARLTANVHGLLTAPRFEAELRGAGLRAGGVAFHHVDASASGTPAELDVATRLVGGGGGPSVAARAHLSPGEGLLVSHARVTLARERVTSTATIDALRVAAGTIEVRGARVEGLGAPVVASARLSRAEAQVKVDAVDVDLARVATLLGRGEHVRGRLALDVDAVSSRRGIVGHLTAELRELSADSLRGGRVHVGLKGDGARLEGELDAALGDVGKLALTTTDFTLGGPATALASWKSAAGSVGMNGDLDLARLLAAIPEVGTIAEKRGGAVVRSSAYPSARIAAIPRPLPPRFGVLGGRRRPEPRDRDAALLDDGSQSERGSSGSGPAALRRQRRRPASGAPPYAGPARP